MDKNDLIAMFANLSRSLPKVQLFLGGLSYLMGIAFIMVGLEKFRKHQESGQHGSTSSHAWEAYAYLLAGAAMLYLPSTFGALSSSFFGAQTSVLAYGGYDPYDIYPAMELLIETVGIIWFLRGCVLLAHSSKPNQGKQSHGLKGLVFLVAGLFSINFQSTVAAVNTVLKSFFSWTGFSA